MADSIVVERQPVAEPSADVKMAEAKRGLPRALMGGSSSMRAAAETYTPKHEGESKDTYQRRLNTTTLYGIFAETVQRMAAKFFVKPIVVNETVPEGVKTILDDVDGESTALDPFMMTVTRAGFVDGVSYVLVDAPRLKPGATLADQRELKARPYWVHIPAERVLGWKTEVIGGNRVLSQFRYKENVDVAGADAYSESIRERIRVLNIGGYEVWEKQSDSGVSKWIKIEEGSTTWQQILVVPVYINRCGYFNGLPPLASLAELCQEHWNSSSEQRHALTMLRFAMLVVTGITDKKQVDNLSVGPETIISLPSGGTAKFVEHSGAGLESGDKDLQNIEARMEKTGMELRVENAGSVTATAAAIDSQETNAGLKAVSKGIEDAVNTLFQYTAVVLNIPDGGDAEVFDEFAENVETTDVPQLLTMYNTGVISRETLWKELKRRHVLDDDFDPDTEEKLLAVQGPVGNPNAPSIGVGGPAAARGTPPRPDTTLTP